MNYNQVKKSEGSRSEYLRKIDDRLRRLMDIFIALFGMIFLSPVFLLVAIAIKRSSPGPVFYWGPRSGKNGRTFRILKFRTMYERKESYAGPKVTPENDPRVTPLGRILRQTKINEFPQLWNVLIGDMSVVGPRPEDPTISAEWPAEVRKEILSVRPGITSPASVIYRNEENLLQSSNLMDTYLWDIIPSKLRLDQLYVRNRSVLTDLDVIFWTMVGLLPRLKDFAIPEHMLYWGPLAKFTIRHLRWFFIDFFIAFIAVAAAGVLRRLTTPLDLGFYLSVSIALLIALLFSLINALSGANRINWAKARGQDAMGLAFSTAVVTAVVLVANLVFPRGNRFPISVILLSGILSYFGFVAVRYRTRLLTHFARRWINRRGSSISSLGEHVLIVGAGEVAQFAVWLLSNENLAQAFSIVGMVDDDPRKIGTIIDGVPVISTTSAIPDMVAKHDVGLVLFAIADINPTDQDRILSLCQSTPAKITPIPDILDNLRAQFPNNETEREVHFNKVLHNATTDRLTGVYNRPHFLRLAEVEFDRSGRYGHPMAILALSIDYIRPMKASYARTIASQVLQAAANRCTESLRRIDLIGRYSDELLVVLLPETDQAAGQLVARRLEEQVMAAPVDTIRGPIETSVLVSMVTNQQHEFHDVEHMLQKALEPFRPAPPAGETVSVNIGKFKETS